MFASIIGFGNLVSFTVDIAQPAPTLTSRNLVAAQKHQRGALAPHKNYCKIGFYASHCT
jgi:hypothetical protein